MSMRSLPRKVAISWVCSQGCVLSAIGILCCWNACAELKIVPLRSKMPLLFGGGTRSLEIAFENTTAKPIETDVRTRLFQVAQGTTIPLGDIRAWKKLQVGGRQTVIEPTPVELPDVRSESRFLLQWIDAEAKVLGSIQMFAYPTNVLRELGTFCEKKPLGVLDPADGLASHPQGPGLKKGIRRVFEEEAGQVTQNDILTISSSPARPFTRT